MSSETLSHPLSPEDKKVEEVTFEVGSVIDDIVFTELHRRKFGNIYQLK